MWKIGVSAELRYFGFPSPDDPAAERDGATLQVGDREHDPVEEAVLDRAAVPHEREVRLHHLVAGEPLAGAARSRALRAHRTRSRASSSSRPREPKPLPARYVARRLGPGVLRARERLEEELRGAPRTPP